jgi:hypothetical protein
MINKHLEISAFFRLKLVKLTPYIGVTILRLNNAGTFREI